MGGLISYLSYDVALFTFISGYFYSEKCNNTIQNVLLFIRKKLKKLLIPYLLWNVVYGIIAIIIQSNTQLVICPSNKFNVSSFFISLINYSDGFIYNVASWFLVAIFLTSIIYIMIRYLLKIILKSNNELVVLIICFFFSAISFIFLNYSSPFPLSIFRSLYLLFYFSLGFFYKQKLEKYDEKYNFLSLLIIVLILCLINLRFGDFDLITYNMNIVGSVSLIFIYIKSIASIHFWLIISKIITIKIPESKYISYYARHTFSLMMHQGLVGLALNGLYIFVTKDYNKMPNMRFDIWNNCIQGSASVLMPVMVSIIIIVAVHYFDKVKVKYGNSHLHNEH